MMNKFSTRFFLIFPCYLLLQGYIGFSQNSNDVLLSRQNNDSTLQMISFLPEVIVNHAKDYLGTSYRRGGKGPKQFDCSGFTGYIFRIYGYSLGASCVDQITEGIKIDKAELKVGDLIFFKGRKLQSQRAGHVGIVVSNIDGNIEFIHASCEKGVTIDRLETSDYYKKRYMTGLRILKDNF